jgi:phosphatidylglycerophosphatase A
VAPGTFGSAAGLALFALIRWSGSISVELGAIALLLALGVWSGNLAEKHFGRVDPAPFVLDEVAGMLITLALMPVTLFGAFVGFLIFRLFDVIKPWPANRLEALPGGLGMMADDAMAAVYGNVAMRILVVALPAGWLA